MFCPQCGNSLTQPSAFCPSCGGQLDESVANIQRAKRVMCGLGYLAGAIVITSLFLPWLRIAWLDFVVVSETYVTMFGKVVSGDLYRDGIVRYVFFGPTICGVFVIGFAGGHLIIACGGPSDRKLSDIDGSEWMLPGIIGVASTLYLLGSSDWHFEVWQYGFYVCFAASLTQLVVGVVGARVTARQAVRSSKIPAIKPDINCTT